MNDYGGPGRISWYLYNRLFYCAVFPCCKWQYPYLHIWTIVHKLAFLLFSFLQVVKVMFTCLLCLLVRLNCPCSLSVLRVCNMMWWSVKNVQLLGIFHMKATMPKVPRYLHYMRACLCTYFYVCKWSNRSAYIIGTPSMPYEQCRDQQLCRFTRWITSSFQGERFWIAP